jgi:apolipoprotein N-acyltransferase
MVKVIMALVGGLGMGLTPAPLSAWFLAWVALVPLWILVATECKSWRRVVVISLAWGLGYYGLALFWITGVHPMTWMGVPWLSSLAIATVCWLLITAWGIALVVVWGLGMAWVYRHQHPSLLRILVGVALWCALESFWSQGPLWWSSLSYTQSPHNLLILQLGKLSGAGMITSVLVGVNGFIAEGILSKRRNWGILGGLGLLLVAQGLGWWLFSQPLAIGDREAIRVGIIQGNIPNAIKLYPEGWQRAIEGYTTGYEKLASQGVDVVLTPETALPFFWEDIRANSPFYRAVSREKVPVWLGAFGSLGASYTNSLFMVTGEGQVMSRYDKVKLVPLGEYIPFQEILGGLIKRISPLDAHLVPGNPDQVFTTPFGQAVVGICYESAFGEHFRRQTAQGGQFMLTASNNAHYSAAMPAQHHALDVMRAIESDRWMARATNTGYSAIVNPHGETLWISALETYELHQGRIYRRTTKTPYILWGDWWSKGLMVLALGSYFLYRIWKN